MSRTSSVRLVMAAGLMLALVGGVTTARQRSASTMAAAARAWLASLTPEQRKDATFAIESDEHTRWNFIPNESFPRKGLTLRAMTDNQQALAHELLKTGLSQRGYGTVTAIMALEDILRVIEAPTGDTGAGGRRFARNPLEYYVTVFGTPGSKETWGWRVEGHHVSVRFVVRDGVGIASSPTFFGSNPAEVRVEGATKGLRVLAAEEDAARALLETFTAQQKASAIFNTTSPNEIITNTTQSVVGLSPPGLMAGSMTARQKELLMQLIDVYTGFMTPDVARARQDKIKSAGLDMISFAWAGETEKGKKHYYRVQGPTFLVEYDNTQNDGNHIHSVWRDFAGDFGKDLLREHLAAYPH